MTTASPSARHSLLAGAALASLLIGAAVARVTFPPPDGDTDRLLHDLEENAKLHRTLAEQAEAMYKAGRIPERDLTAAQIGVCEAELLVARVQEDGEEQVTLLKELIQLRERSLAGLKTDEPADVAARASQELAEARVRLWKATRPEN